MWPLITIPCNSLLHSFWLSLYSHYLSPLIHFWILLIAKKSCKKVSQTTCKSSATTPFRCDCHWGLETRSWVSQCWLHADISGPVSVRSHSMKCDWLQRSRIDGFILSSTSVAAGPPSSRGPQKLSLVSSTINWGVSMNNGRRFEICLEESSKDTWWAFQSHKFCCFGIRCGILILCNFHVKKTIKKRFGKERILKNATCWCSISLKDYKCP